MKFSTLWVMFSRTRMYVAILNFIMLGYIFFRDNTIPFWLIIPMMGALALVTLLDWKYVFSRELGRQSEKNPVSMQTLSNTKKILKEIERRNTDI